MISSQLLDTFDQFTRRRLELLATLWGVSPSKVAALAVTTDPLFSAPEPTDSPRFLRVIEGGRMADEADQAQPYEEDTITRALAAIPRYQGESATDCGECHNPIPEGRRKAAPGCSLCAPCQDKADLKQKHQAK